MRQSILVCASRCILTEKFLRKTIAALCVVVVVAVVSVEPRIASAGEIRDFFETLGGCQNSQAPMMALEQPLSLNSDVTYLGKKPADWTDGDITEFRTVYAECLRRWPGRVMSSFRLGEPMVARSEAVKAKVDRRVTEIMTRYLGPIRSEIAQQRASDEARQRLAKAKALNDANAERRVAEHASERAEKDLVDDRERERVRREALDRQARDDLEAAEHAKRLAEEEAPLIASAQQRAENAHKARLEAERRLMAQRQSLDVAQQTRSVEDAGLRLAEKKRQAQERLERERKEDTLLAANCSITSGQFNKLTLGMTLRQVQHTFGCQGVLTSSSQGSRSTVTSYRWQGTRGFSVTLFEGEVLDSKFQYELE